MSEELRPKRVVVLDADNPLDEIRGEFFWREDHERIVAAEQITAFDRGYAEGYAAARRWTRPRLVIRYRRRGYWWLLRLSVAALVTVCFLVVLTQGFVHS